MSEYAAIGIRDGVRASLQIPRPLQDIVIGYVVSDTELLFYMPNVWYCDEYEDEFPYKLMTEEHAYMYIDVINTSKPSITFDISSFTMEKPIDDVYDVLADIFRWIKRYSRQSESYIAEINAHIAFILKACAKHLLAYT